MIKPVLSNSGQASATTPPTVGVSSGGDTGGNSHAVEDMIVVTDFPDNLDRVRRLLKDLDRRPQQVLVEATILRATLSEDNALGVDFNVLAGVKFTDFTTAAGQVTGANVTGQTSGSGSTGGAGGSTTGGGGVNTFNGGNLGSAGTGNSFTSTIPGGMKIGFV